MVTSKRVNWPVGLVVLIVVFLILVGAFGLRKPRWEPILHLIGAISKNEADMKTELQQFERLIGSIIISWDGTIVEEPPTELEDYLQVDFPEKINEFGGGPNAAFRYLQTGVDPWGSKFIFKTEFTRIDDREAELKITLRSIGSNQLDEEGKGDDLQRVRTYPCLFKAPDWTPASSEQPERATSL